MRRNGRWTRGTREVVLRRSEDLGGEPLAVRDLQSLFTLNSFLSLKGHHCTARLQQKKPLYAASFFIIVNTTDLLFHKSHRLLLPALYQFNLVNARSKPAHIHR